MGSLVCLGMTYEHKKKLLITLHLLFYGEQPGFYLTFSPGSYFSHFKSFYNSLGNHPFTSHDGKNMGTKEFTSLCLFLVQILILFSLPYLSSVLTAAKPTKCFLRVCSEPSTCFFPHSLYFLALETLSMLKFPAVILKAFLDFLSS